MVGTCNTLVKNNGVCREGRVKEPMLAIDKPVPSPIITLYDLLTAKGARFTERSRTERLLDQFVEGEQHKRKERKEREKRKEGRNKRKKKKKKRRERKPN